MVVMGGNSRNVVLAAELIKSMSTAADKYVVAFVAWDHALSLLSL